MEWYLDNKKVTNATPHHKDESNRYYTWGKEAKHKKFPIERLLYKYIEQTKLIYVENKWE